VRALVTGAAGFVGSHLVDHLVAEADEVLTTNRATGGPDLLDYEGLRELLDDLRPEVVFNLAGHADVAQSWQEPLESIRTNGEGTFNVLAAARSAGVERVVTVISSDIYGVRRFDDLPITEEAPFQPISPYAAGKAVADIVASQAHLGFGQDVVRARSFGHFGPGQGENAVCSALAARVARSELAGAETMRVGNLNARRDFTDVRDVVRAYRLLATRGRTGCAYNVCSGTSVTIGTVLDILLAHAERPLRVISDPELYRPVDLHELRGDASQLEADTGWSPYFTLESSLIELLNDWRCRVRCTQSRLEIDDSAKYR
jgi:GDP-4-dehydro-6-deoxy-D-mannose reductase